MGSNHHNPPATCRSWQDVNEQMRQWYDSAESVAFAYIEAPTASGKSTRLVNDLGRIAAISANKTTRALYSTSTVSKMARIQQWHARQRNDADNDPKIEIVADPTEMVGKVVPDEAACQLVIFDLDEDWGMEFTVAMLRLASVLPTKGMLRIVWLASVAFSDELKRAMRLFNEYNGSAITTLQLVYATRKFSLETIKWESYEGEEWTDESTRQLTTKVIADHMLQLRSAADYQSEVVLFGSDEGNVNDMKRAIDARIHSHDTENTIIWDEQYLQSVLHRTSPPGSVHKAQAACAFAHDARNVTVHALLSPRAILNQKPRRRFEEEHLASFLLVALSTEGMTLQRAQRAFASNGRIWNPAIKRLQILGYLHETVDSPVNYRVDASASTATVGLIHLTGWHLSAAHFLSSITGLVPANARLVMCEMAAMNQAFHQGDALFSYDLERHKDEVLRGEPIEEEMVGLRDEVDHTFQTLFPRGAFWAAVSLYRAAKTAMEKEPAPVWMSRDKRISISERAVQLVALRSNVMLRGVNARLGSSSGLADEELRPRDMFFIDRQFFRAWVHRLVLVNNLINDLGELDNDPDMCLAWSSHSMSLVPGEPQGLFLFDATRQAEGGLFCLIGNCLVRSKGQTSLCMPRAFNLPTTRPWLEHMNLTIDTLSVG
ncbi:hypothetical protein CPAR01_12585 [Colletotrichum paranaense]|uniref:Ankyrin and HET domain-containing protein n=1 Tax=Colletotrichum paranaense TaxID=1914294 RepID=A0ABQ9S7I1_9PEZI|nr:uncharacterized protein CPAR01_12585 [Colletotrichum paranaense]KAK1528027.1 hypothetical protein CPAR01_12585 [Colletotrichum paranaense]